MKKDFLVPQGKFKVGRDIPEGVYLIAAPDEEASVSVDNEDGYRLYYLDDQRGKVCHLELKKDDVLNINGSVKLRHITKFISGENNFSLLEEIEDFQKTLQGSKHVKKR